MITLLLYKYVIGLYLGNKCIYYPSCSLFAEISLIHYSSIVAMYLFFNRIMRC
ncbi:MAG: membrane protein insertion efficiency factor YidD [Deltaproteobacteria bacterium]|nr:MAG: membrane protein insertion efficiency factor YidD [Deltaproteobacteria bacterium]